MLYFAYALFLIYYHELKIFLSFSNWFVRGNIPFGSWTPYWSKCFGNCLSLVLRMGTADVSNWFVTMPPLWRRTLSSKFNVGNLCLGLWTFSQVASDARRSDHLRHYGIWWAPRVIVIVHKISYGERTIADDDPAIQLLWPSHMDSLDTYVTPKHGTQGVF